ncbi:hypothetical protein DFH06DRAFT_1336821 [Mycena polygramma]|nr:hypothetical protein DFH06DRAFT_1336821 [Mycena polygramma]
MASPSRPAGSSRHRRRSSSPPARTNGSRRSRSPARQHQSTPSRSRSSSPTRRSRSPTRRSRSTARRSRSPGRSSASRHDSSRDDADDGVDYKAAFKALQASNMMEASKKRKRAPEKRASTNGARGIRKLAALFGELPMIITEAESYLAKGRYPDDDFDEFTDELTDEEINYLAEKRECERNLVAYEQIMRLVPCFRQKLLSEVEDLCEFYTVVQKAANDSRSEDIIRITKSLGTFINKDSDRAAADIAVFDHTPDKIDDEGKTVRGHAPVLFEDRVNRGPDHDICGGLLTCIDDDWDQASVRHALRDTNAEVNKNFFCRIFYRGFQGDPKNPREGYLQSRYMVKGFKVVYTGPKSAKDDDAENTPAFKKPRTAARAIRKPPCEIFYMNGKVTIRSIAYIAVLLHFALSNASQWSPVCYGFSYPQMYNFIIDYLEAPRPGTPHREHVDKLLAWWNQQIFPHHASSASTQRTSVNSMAALRAAAA